MKPEKNVYYLEKTTVWTTVDFLLETLVTRRIKNILKLLKQSNYKSRILHPVKIPFRKGRKAKTLSGEGALKEFITVDLLWKNYPGDASDRRQMIPRETRNFGVYGKSNRTGKYLGK